MIEKVDLLQKALHHRKVALLDNYPPGEYMYRMLFEDLNDKLSEVIDHVNKLEGNKKTAKIKKRDNAMKLFEEALATPRRTPGEKEVLSRFVNPGESCLTISASNVLHPHPDITGFDVVMVKKIDAETDKFDEVADVAILIANKRAILGIHESLMDRWHMYMARVPFHWESYEYAARGNEMEYYIIDKLEGQEETLAPPSFT